MPTRRSNRLRAASADTAPSVTPDAPQPVSPVEPTPVAPTAVQMSTAATSRRARRMAAAGAPAAQPMTAPAVVIAEPASTIPAEPVIVESIAAESVAPARPRVVESPIVSDAMASERSAFQPEAPTASDFTASAAATFPSPASDVDPFAVASEAFGFASVDDESDAPASDIPVADEPVVEGAAPDATHVVTRRGRAMRRVAAAGASFGVMGVAGLIAVSMTLPVSAVAASQGSDATVAASLVAADDESSTKVADDEIQAYVASSDVQGEALERSESFETVSLVEVAAEEGIRFSESLYTNDPDAAIQWPFIVGVAMSSPYGQRWGRLHAGIDLVPGSGAPIQAIADGVVREATEAGGAYGVTVYIDHVIDGQVVTSHYAHMQHGSLQVQAGQEVKVGDIIGKVGNTGRSYGAHLHFEIIINGSTIDPLPWMRKNAGRYEY